MNKKFIISLFLLIVLAFTGCAQNVFLQESLSDLTLSNIHSNYNTILAYKFTSEMPAIYQNKGYKFDVYKAYKEQLKMYFNTKYSVQQDSDNIIVDVNLKSCKQTTKDITSGGRTTANLILGAMSNGAIQGQWNYLINTEVDLQVDVIEKGKIVAKKYIISKDIHNCHGYDGITSAEGFNKAIGKSIIMLDKFLDDVIPTRK